MPDESGAVDLSAMSPKPFLRLRLMTEGGWKILTFAGLIFALSGVIALIVVLFVIAHERAYSREGLVAPGTVTGKEVRESTNYDSDGVDSKSYSYWVDYTFAVEGRTIAGSGRVPKADYEGLLVGGPVDVQYLASDEATNRPLQDKTAMVWAFLLIPVVLFLVGGVLLGISWRRAARHGFLLVRGRLITGMIDAKEERTNIEINGRHPFTVRYSFQTGDGRGHTGEDLVTDLAFAATLTAGEPVGVIHMPEDPEYCALFRDKWRRYFAAG
jgi:hypothetical protein